MSRTLRAPAVLLTSALVLWVPLVARAASRPTPGFNLFSVEQDVEIGRQSAVEAERQIQLLNDPSVDRYLNKVIDRLAAQAPGASYPYAIKAVNDSAINAFSLPGGPMYVNRGLFEAATSEAELAGVLAHEMSHVALRHGTHQASRAYLSQAGLGILGGLLGRNGGRTESIVNAVGGVGLNAAFLKFSRDDEYQADQLGAEIMAEAGYDPRALANIFELLSAEQGHDPGRLERFFSDHPPSAERNARIRDQAQSLRVARAHDVGGFDRMRADLHRQSPASSPVAQSSKQPTNQGNRNANNGRYDVRVARPSSRFERFEQRNGLFSIEHPDNWRSYAPDSGYAASFAPDGGVVDLNNGQQAMLYGVIVNHYEPFEGYTNRQAQRGYAPIEDSYPARGSLEDATDDLVRETIRSNSYLRAQRGHVRRERIDGVSSYSVELSGRSPVTGQEEKVTVVTRGLPDGHVIYALCIRPGRGHDSMAQTFTRMLRTLDVDGNALHRTADR